VLKPPSITSLISRAVSPLTPCISVSSVLHARVVAPATRTSSAETGVGAPGAPIVLSSYCSSSLLILTIVLYVREVCWAKLGDEMGAGLGVAKEYRARHAITNSAVSVRRAIT
jgi:hypothetical protein